jgi:hypothetical protein
MTLTRQEVQEKLGTLLRKGFENQARGIRSGMWMLREMVEMTKFLDSTEEFYRFTPSA